MTLWERHLSDVTFVTGNLRLTPHAPVAGTQVPSPECVAEERQPCDGVRVPRVPGAAAPRGHKRSYPVWPAGPWLHSDRTLDRKSLPWEPRPSFLPPPPCWPAHALVHVGRGTLLC